MKNKTVTKEIMAERLKKLMEDNNETTYTLAERFNLTSPTISRYTTAQMAPKVTTINAIAEYFHVNPVWLMGYDEPKILEKDISKIASSRILKYYELLNDAGKIEAEKQVENLTLIDKYKKDYVLDEGQKSQSDNIEIAEELFGIEGRIAAHPKDNPIDDGKEDVDMILDTDF